MKQLSLFLFAVIAFSAITKAQSKKTIQNGDFESWDSTSYTDLQSPWETTALQDFTSFGTATATKVVGQSGSAVHVQTYLFGKDTISGSVFLNIPATQKPASLKGYYRSNIAGHDTAFIYVGFEKAGNTLSVQSFKVLTSVKSFTPFTINIPAFSGTPDTIVIVVSMTNLFDSTGISTSTPGSWLELDGLSFSGNGTSLQIPDGNFDSWVTNSLYDPIDWAVAPGSFGNSSTGVSKSTNHYSGKYSVKIVAQPFTSFGQLSSGKFISNKYGSTIVGGAPYSLSSDTLTGYYEYIPSGLDTAALVILCSKNGNPVGVGFNTFLAAPTWTYFEVPFSMPATPDSMLINISATSKFFGGAGSSILYLDDLQLKSQPHTAGIPLNSTASFNVSAFPNPAQNQLNIRFGENTPSEFSLKIYNAEGRLMTDNEFQSGASTVTVPIDKLSAGLYFYQLAMNGSIIRNKFMKE